MSHPIENGKCYVVHQGFGDIYNMFGGRTNLLNYPENFLNSFQRRCGVKYTKSIITESAQMICCYDRKDVFVWENGEWINPDIQTYGTSYELIESSVLGFTTSIAINIVGGESCTKLENKLKEKYKV